MGSVFFLKQGSITPAPGEKLIKRDDYARLLEAADILDAARAEAGEIRRAAQLAYEREKERGYQDGLEDGKMEMTVQMLDSLSTSVDYLEGLESTMVELIMNALSKIVDGFDDEERVLGVARKALNYVRNQKKVTLRTSPEDAEMAQAHLDELLRQYPGISILDIVPDPRLEKGACILESEMGLIDASLPTQLAGIRRAFARRLSGDGTA